MAASGKKNKKNKWKQVDIGTVLQETRPVVTGWADEVEIDERELQIAAARKSALPTAPRSARGSDDERVPHSPPFVAYITNIPFETEENDIAEFFGDLQIENIRLPRNEGTTKLKGYGYVEFTERQGLIEALSIADTSMKGRRIRIDVSENNDRDRGYGRSDRMGRDRMGMGMGMGGDQDPDRAMGDWRSAPRVEPAGEDRMRAAGAERRGFGGGGFGDREGRERESGSGFGAPRESDNREGGWREGMGSGTTGGSSFGDRDRDRDRDSFRSRGFGDRERDGDRGGFDRDRDRGSRFGTGFGDRYGDRERDGDRPRYGGDREGDRYGDRPRYGDREREEDKERFARREEGPPSSDSSEPKARPKLQLQPRTRPIETPQPTPEELKEKEMAEREKEKEKEREKAAPPAPRASIFGAAKPVDTTAREREIEDRLAKEKDRAPRRDDQDKGSENSRSKDDSADDSKKAADAAPPPKENAWSRRPRVEPSANNGDTESDQRATSPGSYDGNGGRPSSGERGRQESREDDRNYVNNKDRNDGENRTNRSDSRDNDDKEFSRGKGDGENTERYERKGGRGRSGPHGPPKGMGHAGVDRGGVNKGKQPADGVNKGKQSADGVNKGKQPADRPSHRDHSNEDQRRLPKYEEKPQPNFVASNKYAFLNEDDGQDAD